MFLRVNDNEKYISNIILWGGLKIRNLRHYTPNYPQLILYGLIIYFLSIGCAGTGTLYETPDQVAQATKVREDPYTNTTWITSPSANCGDSLKKCYFRTAFINGKFAFYQLVVTVRIYSWLFLDTAYDIQGNKLDLVELDRRVLSGGTIKEIVAVNLTDQYMVQAMTDGLNISIRGKRGQTIVKLSGFYILGYLQKVGTYMLEAGMISEETKAIMKTAIDETTAKQQKDLANLANKIKKRGKIGIKYLRQKVVSVDPGSPAEIAGLRAGDMILKVDGQELNGDTLHDGMLLTGDPGSKVKLQILRDGKRRTLVIVRGTPQAEKN